jgi:hypothetical protein
VPALCLTAWKSRGGVLRRRAIGLLDRAGVEGVWNGRVIAAVGRRVVELEEQGMGGDGDGEGFEGKEIRLRNVVSVPEVDMVGRMGIWRLRRGGEGVVVCWEG